MQSLFSNRILRKLLPPALGALAGLAYWRFAGCATGSCPITSHWWSSVVYGTIAGAAFLLPGKSEKRGATGPDE